MLEVNIFDSFGDIDLGNELTDGDTDKGAIIICILLSAKSGAWKDCLETTE